MAHPDQLDPNVALWNGDKLYRENVPGRRGVFTDEAAALTTAVMLSVGVPVCSGDLISNITFLVGATAGATITNQWGAFYTPGGVLISQSADGTNTAIPASTPLTFALATPHLVKLAGIFYAAVMVKATTVPSLVSQNRGLAVINGAVLAGQAVAAQTSGSALTTTAPGTIATPTTVAKAPYVVLS